MKKNFLLIDADEIISDIKNACNYINEAITEDIELTYNDYKITIKKGTFIDAISDEEIACVTNNIIQEKIYNIKQKLNIDNVDKIYFFLTTRSNFRKELSEEYKKKSSKSYVNFKNPIIRNYIKESFETFEIENLEADDLISIHSEYLQKKYLNSNIIISSQDKDMNTIPNVFIYNDNAVNDEDIFYFNSSRDSVLYYLSQLLSGDVADSVTNTPCRITDNKIMKNGYNKKGAFNLLNDLINNNYSLENMFYFIKNLYIKNNIEDQFIINCKLLRMTPLAFYDKENKEVINYNEEMLLNYLIANYYTL